MLQTIFYWDLCFIIQVIIHSQQITLMCVDFILLFLSSEYTDFTKIGIWESFYLFQDNYQAV